MTAAAWIGTKLARIYQVLISPMLGDNCRFYPTCSQYAIDALTAHGFLKGTWLTIIRLCKCAPWHPGGYDPVPPAPDRGHGAYSYEDGDR